MPFKNIIVHTLLVFGGIAVSGVFAQKTALEVVEILGQASCNIRRADNLKIGLKSSREQLRELASQEITLPATVDFAMLQSKSRQLGIQTLILSTWLSSSDDFAPTIIELAKIYFQILSKMASRLNEAYENYRWQDKFANVIPFVQTKSAINLVETNLLAIAVNSYIHLNDTAAKIDFWLALSKMFEKLNIEVSETGAITDEFHSVLILYRLVTIGEHIKEIYRGENDAEVKSHTSTAMRQVRYKLAQFSAQFEEAKIKQNLNKDFFEKYNTGKYLGANAERVFMPFDAAEWFAMASETADYTTKIAYLTNAIAFDTNFVAAYIARGNCYNFLGRHEAGIEDYKTAIRLDPSNAVAHYNCGISYKNIDRFAEAIQCYDRALELNSKNAAAFINRGVCYAQMDQHKRAIEDYSKALQLNPNNITALKNRAMSYRKIGEYQNAIGDNQEVIDRLPNDATAYYNLGCIFWDIKDWEGVVRAWEEVLRIQPQHSYVRKNLKFAKKYAREERLKKALRN